MVCWYAVIAFILLAGAYGLSMHNHFAFVASHPDRMSCGNLVTGPLEELLGLGVPVVFVAVAGLGFLRHHNLTNRWPVIAAAAASVAVTAALAAFGVHFFRTSLPNFFLSDIVWWMRPVGKWFGV